MNWHEDEVDISPEARDFINRLLCTDPARRLGVNGSAEVTQHPFLATVDWANLLASDAAFVPRVTDPESTDYFDARGAVAQTFDDDDAIAPVCSATPQVLRTRAPFGKTASDPVVFSDLRNPRERSETAPQPTTSEDFGTFNFKNLEVLKQANQEVIRKLKISEQMQPLGLLFDQAPQFPPSHPRHAALAQSNRSSSTDTRVCTLPSYYRWLNLNIFCSHSLAPIRLLPLYRPQHRPSRVQVVQVTAIRADHLSVCGRRNLQKSAHLDTLDVTPCRLDYALRRRMNDRQCPTAGVPRRPQLYLLRNLIRALPARQYPAPLSAQLAKGS